MPIWSFFFFFFFILRPHKLKIMGSSLRKRTKKPATPPQTSHKAHNTNTNPATLNQPNTNPLHAATQTQTHHIHGRENKITERERERERGGWKSQSELNSKQSTPAKSISRPSING